VLPAEQLTELGVLERGLDLAELRGDLAARFVVVLLLGELEQRGGVVEGRLDLLVERELALEGRLLPARLLRRFAVVPEVRARDLALELREPRALSREVKDAPGTRRSGPAGS
jgi:hypothetical protein